MIISKSEFVKIPEEEASILTALNKRQAQIKRKYRLSKKEVVMSLFKF